MSPALLVTTENQRVDPDTQRQQALKTWLGKRYDRPAASERGLLLLPTSSAHAVRELAIRMRNELPAGPNIGLLKRRSETVGRALIILLISPSPHPQGAYDLRTAAAAARASQLVEGNEMSAPGSPSGLVIQPMFG